MTENTETITQTDTSHWSLDRRIQPSLLIGLALQTIVFSFWMGTMSAQISHNTDELRSKKTDAPRLAVIETRVGSLDASINRLTNTIDRLLQGHTRSNK